MPEEGTPLNDGPDARPRASNAPSNPKQRQVKNNSQSGSRKLARQACTACRVKKIRCDATRPKCAYCTSHGCPCIFPPMYKRALCSQSYVDALQEKVREYEAICSKSQLVSSLRNDGNTMTPEQQSMQSLGQQQYYHHSEQRNLVEKSVLSVSGEEDEEPVDNRDDNSPITDGMVQYTAASPERSDDDGFFTESSNLHFAMSLTMTVQRWKLSYEGDCVRRDCEDNQEKTNLQSSSNQPKASGRDITLRDFSEHDDNGDLFQQTLASPELQSLPLRHMAENLFDRYFRIVNIAWPFLLEDVTRDRFNRMWMSSKPQNPVWMAQINLIMSLACQFYEEIAVGNESLPKMYEAGKQFYRRARGFMIPTMLTGNSIGMLQNLLLMVQYQQGTLRANQCWLTIGYAVRMAQGLGLHITISEDKSLSVLEVELRKRLWWGCFCLDRVSSMIYGGPLGISQVAPCNFVDELPKPIDDEYLAQDQGQPRNVPSVNAFLGCNVKLYSIMDGILEKLSKISNVQKRQDMASGTPSSFQGTTPIENNAFQFLTNIIQVDESLSNWHAKLPNYLGFPLDKVTWDGCDDGISPQIQRQRNILRARFLGMRVLLHRQNILALLQNLDQRIYYHGTTNSWLALFSNVTSAASNTPLVEEAGARQPPLEIVLARHSARICVSSALLQIESIDATRPLRSTGAWWWNFHFLFNSLCVLIGAMAMKPDDIAAVAPDIQKVKAMVERGLRNIHELGERGGESVWHSERMLRRLIRTTQQGVHAETSSDGQPRIDTTCEGMSDFWDTLTTVGGLMTTPRDNPNDAYLNCFSPKDSSAAPLPSGAGVEKCSPEVDMGEILPLDLGGGNDLSSFTSGISDLNPLEGLFQASPGEWCILDKS
ncbi:fungal-specific transcription factor domain-containing protein [Xylogone sp. PMI_703]|nr:fungal-specific transcription factor domain-containing protein [Xylogone sp. PMI_703]